MDNGISTPDDQDVMYVRIDDRLIFDFEKMACCCGGQKGLHADVKHHLPAELHAKGIPLGKWLEWMTDLDEIQNMVKSIAEYLCMYFIPFLSLQFLVCYLCCPLSMNHKCSFLPCCVGDWHQALREWLERVNEYLNVYGMHAKFLTYKPYCRAPRSKFYDERIHCQGKKYEMSFLAISVTSEATTILREESWDHGTGNCCISGIGRVI